MYDSKQDELESNFWHFQLSKDTTKEKKVELVDIPGNDKVRKKFFDTYKKNAK